MPNLETTVDRAAIAVRKVWQTPDILTGTVEQQTEKSALTIETTFAGPS